MEPVALKNTFSGDKQDENARRDAFKVSYGYEVILKAEKRGQKKAGILRMRQCFKCHDVLAF